MGFPMEDLINKDFPRKLRAGLGKTFLRLDKEDTVT